MDLPHSRPKGYIYVAEPRCLISYTHLYYIVSHRGVSGLAVHPKEPILELQLHVRRDGLPRQGLVPHEDEALGDLSHPREAPPHRSSTPASTGLPPGANAAQGLRGFLGRARQDSPRALGCLDDLPLEAPRAHLHRVATGSFRSQSRPRPAWLPRARSPG